MMIATMPSMRTIRPSSFRRSTAQSRFSTVSFARPPQPSIASRAFPGPVPGIVEEAELILELIQELLRLILHELGDSASPRTDIDISCSASSGSAKASAKSLSDVNNRAPNPPSTSFAVNLVLSRRFWWLPAITASRAASEGQSKQKSYGKGMPCREA
jgi:hypothetical protein